MDENAATIQQALPQSANVGRPMQQSNHVPLLGTRNHAQVSFYLIWITMSPMVSNMDNYILYTKLPY